MSKISLVYTCPSHIKWVTDDTRIIIVNEQQNSHHILTEAEAAIWNWMTIPYSYRKLLPLVTLLWSLPLPKAEERLQLILHKWHEDGLLDVFNGGQSG